MYFEKLKGLWTYYLKDDHTTSKTGQLIPLGCPDHQALN